MFHLNDATASTVRDVLVRNVDRSSTLHRFLAPLHQDRLEHATHRTTNHAKGEYARRKGDVVVHSNTIEGVFYVFKRGMVGVYQHCGEAHLDRYLAEFDFRYNRRTAVKITDAERAADLLRMARDKRLTYRRIGEASHA